MILKQHLNTCVVFALLVFLFPCSSLAQFNLNKFNGLPTDHVYMFLKDRYGYLWIATDKGVLRYNGYEFKLFNISQELGSNDVWRIYKDRKDRIWLYSFSNSFGYLYKNRYHKVVVQEEVINPGWVVYESEAGLMIPKEHRVPGKTAGKDYLLYYEPYREGGLVQYDVIARKEDRIQQYHFNGRTFSLKKECACPPMLPILNEFGNRTAQYRNHVFFFIRKRDRLVYLDIDSCRYKVLLDEKSTRKGFSYILPPENELDPRKYTYLFYKDRVDKLDSMLKPVETFPVNSLTRPGVSGYDLVYLLEDSLWGRCVATESHGGFIAPATANPFKRYSWDASGFSVLKVINDNTAYWWNEQTRVLARIEQGKPPVFMQHNGIGSATRVFEHNAQYDIMFSFSQYYLFDKRTGKQSQKMITSLDTSGLISSGRYPKRYFLSNQNLTVFVLLKQNAAHKILLKERFKDVVKDPARQGHWVYNQHALYFITNKDSCISMKALLKSLGIVQLEKFLVDPFGNLLFLTPDRLLCYNTSKRSASVLLTNCNLSGARLATAGRTLVAAGRYGIAFTTIDSPDTYRPPVIYHNIKDNYYAFVNDIQVLKDSVMVQTNAGSYIAGIPHYTEDRSSELPSHFLFNYADSTYSGKDDVIAIAPQNHVLHLDLVRPAGNGKLRFLYRLEGVDSVWQELNSNALVLPVLETGRKYELLVMAKDEVWQSNVHRVQLLVKPLWWQAAPGLYIMWFGILLVTGGILLLTVLITRRLIEKRSARQKQLLELELKAVYAQINPHFIFNTLNSGLHFIKKQRTDEAYNHILRFSQLLRAYLKASRHRYITLAQEVQNLRHYIELQQTRFGHVFDYTIVFDDILHPENISIPSLLLQPIVENAIEHGLLPKEEHGRLEISFRLHSEKKQLTCTISDNGIGRTRSKAAKSKGEKESYGNELIGELIHLFNKYEKMGIEIAYNDLPEPHTGTSVKIVIKNPHLSYE